MMIDLIAVGLAVWGAVYFVRLCIDLSQPEETFEEQLQHYRDYVNRISNAESEKTTNQNYKHDQKPH